MRTLIWFWLDYDAFMHPEQFAHQEWTKHKPSRGTSIMKNERNCLIAFTASKGCADKYHVKKKKKTAEKAKETFLKARQQEIFTKEQIFFLFLAFV